MIGISKKAIVTAIPAAMKYSLSPSTLLLLELSALNMYLTAARSAVYTVITKTITKIYR